MKFPSIFLPLPMRIWYSKPRYYWSCKKSKSSSVLFLKWSVSWESQGFWSRRRCGTWASLRWKESGVLFTNTKGIKDRGTTQCFCVNRGDQNFDFMVFVCGSVFGYVVLGASALFGIPLLYFYITALVAFIFSLGLRPKKKQCLISSNSSLMRSQIKSQQER